MTRRLVRLRLVVGVALAGLALTGCGGPPPCRLCDAIEARDAAGVRALLAQGEPVTAAALEQAADPLVVPSRTGGEPDGTDREIVEALLDHADPNALWRRATNRGPRAGGLASGSQEVVYFARAVVALFGDQVLVDRLLARGLDAGGTPGGEALREAALGGHLGAARALIDAGAPVNHVGINVAERTTGLAEAIQTRNLEMMALLEAAGAVEWID